MGCSASKTEASDRILMVGLDDSGKTTLLYMAKLGDLITTIPTIGFNVETVSPVKKTSFTIWDVGGQSKIRTLWRHYLSGTSGMVFVVDSADVDRLDEAKEELHKVMEDSCLAGVPLVVVANKQDLPDALNKEEVAARLDLAELRDRDWQIVAGCAVDKKTTTETMKTIATCFKKGGAKEKA